MQPSFRLFGMNARTLSSPLPLVSGVNALTAVVALLSAGANASAIAQKADSQTAGGTPAVASVPIEPCRMLLGTGGITLLTASGAKCEAGAPLNLSAMHVDDYTQRLCDFSKSIVKTKAESFQDTDSVQCLFSGKPLPGPIRVRYGRIVGGKVVDITD